MDIGLDEDKQKRKKQTKSKVNNTQHCRECIVMHVVIMVFCRMKHTGTHISQERHRHTHQPAKA